MTPKAPSIRKMTVVYISLGIFCLLTIICLSSWIILMRGINRLEEKSVRTNMARLQEALSEKISNLEIKLSDWSSWDDTYAFIENRNENYIKSNVMDKTLANLKINLMVFLNNHNAVVYSMGLDLIRNTTLPFPLELSNLCTTGALFINQPNRILSGILMLREGPLLIVSKPILTSEDKGPARGTLLFGTYLDSQEVDELSRLLHLTLHVQQFDATALPAVSQTTQNMFLEGKDRVLISSTANTISGYSLLKDIFGKPALLVNLTMDREIYHSGKISFMYFILVLILVGFVFGAAFFFPLENEIHRHKQAEQFLIEAKKRSDDASKLKSDFLANMSHEIRNPMNSIIGYADLMVYTKLDYEQKNHVDGIRKSSHSLLLLINDILDISKIEAGEIRLEKIDFDIVYLLKNVTIMNSVRIKEKNIQMLCDIEESMPKNFKGDPTRIRQILINLISNAVKFTEKGEILVSVKLLKETQESDVKRRTMTFSVKDTGIGIPKDKQKLLFKAFEQGDSSITRKYGGTGLGLAISKALVEMMGGTIYFESEPNVGTTFFFTLCLEETLPVKEQEIYPLKSEFLTGKRILIMDSCQSSRTTLEIFCKEAGMEVVHSSASVGEAESWLSSHPQATLEFILSEIKVNGTENYEFVKRIKNKANAKAVKIVAITSDIRPGAAREAKEAGFDVFLTKPVIKKELFMVLLTALGDKRPEGPDAQILTRHMARELACKGLKILVVEDDPANQEVMKMLLEALGCLVDAVSNGQLAIEKVKANYYDMVLMDVQMPKMPGYEATRIIRSQINKTLPIVALTGSATKEDHDKCMASGMNDFLTKPIEMENLTEKVIQWGKGIKG
jgi:signal transduction histidine kinase/CheY-like chemotaxis protein